MVTVQFVKLFNLRFFRRGRNGLDNPASGTVVDSIVTLPERYDFYIVSQSVRQGTVNPTSYNVIYDKSGLKPDQMQKLTFKVSTNQTGIETRLTLAMFFFSCVTCITTSVIPFGFRHRVSTLTNWHTWLENPCTSHPADTCAKHSSICRRVRVHSSICRRV